MDQRDAVGAAGIPSGGVSRASRLDGLTLFYFAMATVLAVLFMLKVSPNFDLLEVCASIDLWLLFNLSASRLLFEAMMRSNRSDHSSRCFLLSKYITKRSFRSLCSREK